jgi:hypothetical protein
MRASADRLRPLKLYYIIPLHIAQTALASVLFWIYGGCCQLIRSCFSHKVPRLHLVLLDEERVFREVRSGPI